MPKQKTQAQIAFRSQHPPELPSTHQLTTIGAAVIWSVGESAEIGGLYVPESVVRSIPELYMLWDQFPRVQNQVKRDSYWSIWWGVNLSLVDFITKENKILWIQTKTRAPQASGRILAWRAMIALKAKTDPVPPKILEVLKITDKPTWRLI